MVNEKEKFVMLSPNPCLHSRWKNALRREVVVCGIVFSKSGDRLMLYEQGQEVVEVLRDDFIEEIQAGVWEWI